MMISKPRLTAVLTCFAIAAMASGALGQDQAVQVKASSPDATVKLLTAPHTGQTICELTDGTPLTFVKRADHGPHKFAKVDILEGSCGGKTGYIFWFALDPKPE